MGSLSNLYISQSYQSLIHLATNNTASATLIDLQDGLGNSIGVSVNTGGDLYLSGSLTASLQQGFTYVGNAAGRTTLVATSSFGGATPAGTISSSAQITALGFVSSSITASSLITASFSGNTLTFTKGDSSTFGVVIPDISGSTINTGSFVTTSSFNQYTSSTNNRLNNLESTSASVNISISNLNSTTASQAISISNLNTYTQSNDAKWNTLGGQSGSWITESETASFARTNIDNNFTANQTFTNITAVSASFTYVQTTYETSSVIYSSGSNIFGDELTDTQTLSGSVKVQGSLTVNGTNVLTSSIPLTSLNSFTASQNTKNTTLENVTASLQQFTASNGNTSLNLYTQSNDAKWNTLGGQTGSYVTSAITASSLITASVNLNTITFTKGDASTFNITVDTGSGGTSINTGSFATTGSNIFIGNQTINAGDFDNGDVTLNSGRLTAYNATINNVLQTNNINNDGANQLFIDVASNSLRARANTNISIEASNGVVNITGSSTILSNTFTASLQQGYIWVGDASGRTTTVATSSFGGGGTTDITSLNAFTASQETKDTTLASVTSSLNSATASLYTSASLALVTASVNLNTITFTKGDASTFNITVNTGSGGGGTTDISSLNAFTASQETKDLTLASVTSSLNSYTSSTNSRLNNIETTTASLNSSITNINTFTQSANQRIGSLEAATSSYVTSAITASSLVTASVNLNTITFTKGDASTFSLTVDTGSATSTDITALNSFTASQETKDTTLASVTSSLNSATASLFASASLALVTASFSGNTLTFTKGDTTTFGIVLPDVSGSTIDTGSFATTGSNTFTGDQTLIDAAGNTVTLSDTSGSLMLVAKTFTSASAHLTGSIGGKVNIIFKSNNNTADTIISGSDNIFSNPAAPTAGFKRYVGGSNNIYNSTGLPQISSSMAYPVTMTGNIGPGTFIMRGPISSSTWTLSSNVIQGTVNIGSTAGNNAEKIVSGLTLSTNNIQGTLNVIANQVNLTSSVNISTNTIGGTATLNANSSSATFTNNIVADSGFTWTNNYYTNSVGQGTMSTNRNLIIGQSNTMLTTGIGDVGIGAIQPTLNNNILGGTSNTLFINATSASQNNQLISSIIYGNTLIVTGSSNPNTAATLSSAFFGRYNANDGRRNSSAGTIFAVGTGTSTSVRKTGFLIDSGSNTFVEGTLNVSGATSLNGNLNITGSLTASLQQGFVYVGNASGITTTVATSSFGGGSVPAGTVSSSAQITAFGFISSSSVPTGTVSSSQQILNYGIFATTGSNQFNGSQTITGSLNVSASAGLISRISSSIGIRGNFTFTDVNGGTTNIILGNNAMGSATGSTLSVAIGDGSMRFTSGSQQNVAIGYDTLRSTIGTENVAIASNAMYSNTTGGQNVAIGIGALNQNTTGFRNMAIGGGALFNNTAGDDNVAVGNNAGNETSGSLNTFIGGKAGQYVSGSRNVIIGAYQGTAGMVLNNNIILSDGGGNIKAQYSGSAWAFQDNIKFNKGTNKTTDIVSVNSTVTVNNSLVTATSIILLTTQNGDVAGTVYPAVVMNKGTGTFDIVHDYGGTLDVAYMIINPTT